MITSPAVDDRSRLRRFASFVRPAAQDIILDITPGSHLLAQIFTRRAAAVYKLAPSLAHPVPASAHIHRTEGLATQMPFPDCYFDIVVSGATFHHLGAIPRVLTEAFRVCKPGGRIAIEDIAAPEQEVRAKYQNRLEKLRDRSHSNYLRLSEFISQLGEAGFTVRQTQTTELHREFNEWLSGARPSPQRVELIRRLMTGAQEADLSGLDIRALDDTLEFTQRLAWIVAEKPE